MNKREWLDLYRDIRTPAIGENLFSRHDRVNIALTIAREERRASNKAKRSK